MADLRREDGVGGGRALHVAVLHHARDAAVGGVEHQALWQRRLNRPRLKGRVEDDGVEARRVAKEDHARAGVGDVGVGQVRLQERVAGSVTVDVNRNRRGVQRVRRAGKFLLRGIAVAVGVRFERIAQAVTVGVHRHVAGVGGICAARHFLGVVPRVGVGVDDERVRADVVGPEEDARAGFEHVKQAVVVVVQVLDERAKVVLWERVGHAVVVGVEQHGDGQVPRHRHAGGVGPHRPRHRFRRRTRRAGDAPEDVVEHQPIGQVGLNRPRVHAAVEHEGLPCRHRIAGDEHEVLGVEQPRRLTDDLEAEGGRGRAPAVVRPHRVGAVAPDLFGHAIHGSVRGAEEQALRQGPAEDPRGDVAGPFEGRDQRHVVAGLHHHEGQVLRRVGERRHLIDDGNRHRRGGRTTAVVRPHRVGPRRPQLGRRAPEGAVLGAELHAKGQSLVDGPRGDEPRSDNDRRKRQVRMRCVLDEIEDIGHEGDARQLIDDGDGQRR